MKRIIESVKASIRELKIGEELLWAFSVIVVSVSFIFNADRNIWALISSLVGVTALIFLAKGDPLGQILIILFALCYGVISYQEKYYGEMLTYIGMSMPMAILSLWSWIKHPYSEKQVKIEKVTFKQISAVLGLAVIVTFAFYFILSALGTASIVFSTISVATTFIACAFTFLRSPLYALGYAMNDVVLIVLWVIAASKNISSLPMVLCFATFFINDMYGFYNWIKMKNKQKATE